MARWAVRFLILVKFGVLLFFLGCESPKVLAGKKFENASPPLPDMAKVYIFRPAFRSLRAKEAPQIYIDGKFVFSLHWSSYTEVNLLPGSHTVKIKSEKNKFWDSEFSVNPQKNNTYYLAIWDKNKQTKNIGRSALGALPVLAGAPVFFIISPYGTVSDEVGIELLEKDVAEVELKDCFYMAPI